jgi:integrase/recombinase XerD
MLDRAPTGRTARLAAVIGFLSYNEIELPRNFTRNLYGKDAIQPITEEHVPSNEEIARLVQYMPIQAKTITIVLSSSGMRLGEAMSLNLDDLDLDNHPAKVMLRAKNTKTKRKRFVFISTEAKDALVEWLAYRDQYIESIRNKRGKADSRLFPFTQVNYTSMWTTAVKKAGFDARDSQTRRLAQHPHSLRKYYRTRGGWSNPDIPEALMGHQSGLTAVYARYDQAEEILAKGYLEAEPHLSIFEGSKTVIDLREKVEVQKDEREGLLQLQTRKNLLLDREVAELQDQLKAQTTEQSKLMGTVNLLWAKIESIVGAITPPEILLEQEVQNA